MSQRDSGYARQERDLYETPEWVTEALLPHLPERIERVWEPAAGSGKMVKVLNRKYTVTCSDIADGADFLAARMPIAPEYDAIITNPPYGLAEEFITTAMRHVANDGVVAMLLRTDYDHAKTRQYLFGEYPYFAKKIVLTRRIVWFERPGAAPSFNHAWFIWDWTHDGPPAAIAYGP